MHVVQKNICRQNTPAHKTETSYNEIKYFWTLFSQDSLLKTAYENVKILILFSRNSHLLKNNNDLICCVLK